MLGVVRFSGRDGRDTTECEAKLIHFLTLAQLSTQGAGANIFSKRSGGCHLLEKSRDFPSSLGA